MKRIFQLFCLSAFLFLIFPSVYASGDKDMQVMTDLKPVAIDNLLTTNVVVIQTSTLEGNQDEGIVRSILPEETVSVVVSQEPPSDVIGFGSHATLMNNQKQIQTIEAQGALPGETVSIADSASATAIAQASAATRSETVSMPSYLILKALDAMPGETAMVLLMCNSKSVVPRGNQTPGETVAIVDVVNAESVNDDPTQGILGS